MKLLGLYTIFCLTLGSICWHLVVGSVYRDAVRTVCQTVSERFYTVDFDLDAWTSECLSLRDQVSAFRSKSHVINLLQKKMSELGHSHLGIYVPSETKALWTGVAKDTGLRGRFVAGQFVIFEILPNSPASQTKIQPGDSLATINSDSVTSPAQAQLSAGEFTFLRGGETFRLNLEPGEFQVDGKPRLTEVKPGLAVLKITGFRKELFDAEEWKATAKNQFHRYSSLVIDIRGNPGGSFVAMLRALSVFMCDSKSIGHIVKPRQMMRHGDFLPILPDNLDDRAQVQLFSESPMVNLETFDDYPCYLGELVVVLDQETASVAEIFAEALKEAGRARVIGRASAGDVLLGVWYDFSILGRGFSFSVPEALFQNLSGESLEGIGVEPNQEIDYDLNEALSGQDSILLRAIELSR